MLVRNDRWYIRLLFSGLFIINLFLFPWWWTAAWGLAGIIMFPDYFEAVCAAALLDAVFNPIGLPALTVISFLLVVLAAVIRPRLSPYV